MLCSYIAHPAASLLCRAVETGRLLLREICSKCRANAGIDKNHLSEKIHRQALYCGFPRFYIRATCWRVSDRPAVLREVQEYEIAIELIKTEDIMITDTILLIL